MILRVHLAGFGSIWSCDREYGTVKIINKSLRVETEATNSALIESMNDLSEDT